MEDTAALAPVHEPVLPGEVALYDLVGDVVERSSWLDGRLTVLLPAPGALMDADPERLTLALLSLLRGAAVYERAGGAVELRVLRERDAWRFEVAGEPSQQESVFAPLHREARAALATARDFAEAHGGSAGIENWPGEAATFWFRLPKQL
jgi:signal transduction histidine kinase